MDSPSKIVSCSDCVIAPPTRRERREGELPIRSNVLLRNTGSLFRGGAELPIVLERKRYRKVASKDQIKLGSFPDSAARHRGKDCLQLLAKLARFGASLRFRWLSNIVCTMASSAGHSHDPTTGGRILR